ACPHRLDRLVLVDGLGIKLGGRETPDILDIFNTHPDAVLRASWHDPECSAPDFDALSDAALTRHARNRDALCLYGWEPYMYNPRLKRWLGRIALPTLVLWCASDRIVSPAYGRAYAALLPGARLSLIRKAAHIPGARLRLTGKAAHPPDVEQAAALAERILDFLTPSNI